MEFTNLDLKNFYRVLAPRPTIIITTISSEGKVNAAPFSFTMPVSSDPPFIAVASVPSHHTFQNLEQTRELVINIPSEDILQELWITSEKFPLGVNEIEKAGLTQMPSEKVAPPWIKESIAHMECRVETILECGDHNLVVGEVLKVAARKDAIKEGLLNVELTKPILHLGGKEFVVGDHRKTVE